ncbi:MAG: flagellin [Syntrophothermus sp.]|uniref:flagellin N-terminal helical domain-containing protein n=1 Tax=Syntrophothermus sp. TaxID=2736299 RepID=UPI00257FE5CE|nr:flagellin [Syntrophothermus sp.]NSW84608.1 flagellin [Syntrophothermus sp.]
MIINHNISALNAWRGLSQTNSAMSKSLEKLSSGLRINRAADDAAGLAISEKMRGQIRGLNQAVRNAQDGISLIQTAEGALNETHSILQRMRELADQAANDTLTSADRLQIQKEINQLTEEVQRIGVTTEFNTQKLLDASFANKNFHIGANQDQTLTVSISDMRAAAVLGDGSFSTTTDALGIASSSGTTDASITLVYTTTTGGLATTSGYAVSVLTQSDAEAAITTFQKAIDEVSTERAKLGAYQNRLEHTIANLGVAAENLTAAESRIRDVDMAQEMMNFTRQQILMQAGTVMLAQANMVPQAVLRLLG